MILYKSRLSFFFFLFGEIHLFVALAHIISDVSNRGSLGVSGLSTSYFSRVTQLTVTRYRLVWHPSATTLLPFLFFLNHTLRLLLVIYSPITDNLWFASNLCSPIKKGSKRSNGFDLVRNTETHLAWSHNDLRFSSLRYIQTHIWNRFYSLLSHFHFMLFIHSTQQKNKNETPSPCVHCVYIYKK